MNFVENNPEPYLTTHDISFWKHLPVWYVPYSFGIRDSGRCAVSIVHSCVLSVLRMSALACTVIQYVGVFCGVCAHHVVYRYVLASAVSGVAQLY